MASFLNGDITVISQSNETFNVSRDVAKLSETIRCMMIENDISDQSTSEEDKRIPLPNVSSGVLQKVFEFCHHYNTEIMPPFEKVLDFQILPTLISFAYVFLPQSP
jgi:hypothetical protein